MTEANQESFKECVPDLLDKSRWLKIQQYDISALSVIRMSIIDSLPHDTYIHCEAFIPINATLRHKSA